MKYILVLFTISIFFTSCSKKKELNNNPKKQETIAVDAVKAQYVDFEQVIEVNGSVIPAEYIELRPEISGRITYLNIKEGARITQGAVIAKLYDDDLQAQLKKYESQLQIAQKTLARLKKLLDANGINAQDYDQAEQQVVSLKSDIDYTKAQIRKTQILAPFSGVVGLRNISNGAYVTNQNVLTTIQQIDNLKLDFNVPENYADLVRIGNKVSLVVEGQVDTLSAKIIATEPVINTNSRNLKVRALIEKAKNLGAGKFAKVILKNENKKKSILIPTQAIVPDTRFKKVFVLRNGIADLVNIETGARKESEVQILSGLKEGDTIAINGIMYLRPKAQVKIRSVK